MTPPAAPPDRLVRTLSREGGVAVRAMETLVGFRCGCEGDRVRRGVRPLGEEELRRSAGSGGTLEVRCRFCGDAHRLGPAEVGAGLADA